MQANVYWQGVLGHAKAFKLKAEKEEARANRAEAKIAEMELALKAKEDEMCLLQAELIKGRDNEKKVVDDYLRSSEFVDLMAVHDKANYPVVYSKGWNEALKTVLESHSSAFDLEDFPCPIAPPMPQSEFSSDEEEEDYEDDIMDDRVPGGERLLDPSDPVLPPPSGTDPPEGKDPMDEDLESSSPADDAQDP